MGRTMWPGWSRAQSRLQSAPPPNRTSYHEMADHDLAALWDAHCRYEFETRDVDATMSTMVAEPYVNHIPTMTGGVGFESLRHFYAHHFIGVNPPDFELVPVSRTVGESSLVDEFIVRFTHTTRMDW